MWEARLFSRSGSFCRRPPLRARRARKSSPSFWPSIRSGVSTRPTCSIRFGRSHSTWHPEPSRPRPVTSDRWSIGFVWSTGSCAIPTTASINSPTRLAPTRRPSRGKEPSSVTRKSYVPCRESDGLSSPRCSQRPRSHLRLEITTHFARSWAWPPSRVVVASGPSSPCDTPATAGFEPPSTTGHVSPAKSIPIPALLTQHYAPAVTHTAAPCARSPIGFCASPAPCSVTAPSSILNDLDNRSLRVPRLQISLTKGARPPTASVPVVPGPRCTTAHGECSRAPAQCTTAHGECSRAPAQCTTAHGECSRAPAQCTTAHGECSRALSTATSGSSPWSVGRRLPCVAVVRQARVRRLPPVARPASSRALPARTTGFKGESRRAAGVGCPFLDLGRRRPSSRRVPISWRSLVGTARGAGRGRRPRAASFRPRHRPSPSPAARPKSRNGRPTPAA